MSKKRIRLTAFLVVILTLAVVSKTLGFSK